MYVRYRYSSSMPHYRFQITIPYFSNLPTDVIVNDWSLFWAIGTPAESDFDNARDRLAQFYTDVYGNGVTLDAMAPWVGPASTSLKVYNRADPPPRAPVYEAMASFTADQPSTSVTTPESAVCLSFQADPVSGVPQARRRGRIFLGGWADVMYRGDVNEFPTIDINVRNAIAGAAETLGTGLIADNWIWEVWSTVNGTGAPVTNGWIDDAIDTQRRRGQAPNVRTIWP
jgi:hypothetical protein